MSETTKVEKWQGRMVWIEIASWLNLILGILAGIILLLNHEVLFGFLCFIAGIASWVLCTWLLLVAQCLIEIRENTKSKTI